MDGILNANKKKQKYKLGGLYSHFILLKNIELKEIISNKYKRP